MYIEKYLKERKELIDSKLNEIIEELKKPESLKLNEAIKYSILNGGKRIRPILTIAAFELFNDDVSGVIEPACAIELLHCASLILDDIPCMDDVEYRRGKLATHRIHGEATTILASAALSTIAFEIYSRVKSIRINEIISDTTKTIGSSGMIMGQFLDVDSFNKPNTVDKLNQGYYLKTGILFCNAIKVGALLGKANSA